MNPAYIVAHDVTVTFRPASRDPVTALAGFDVSMARGEFVSLLGLSGCGKSTFLNVVLGLLRPDAGEVRIDGRPVRGPAGDRAMVFQEFGLLPWLVQGDDRVRRRRLPAPHQHLRGRA